MFKTKKSTPSITSTVIGEGVTVENATIKGAGSLRVDGSIYGDIDLDGDIIVGESGYVKGNIKVNHALFAGKVEGNVNSNSNVHITSTGNLIGNIVSMGLVVDEGASFSGNCEMKNKSSAGMLVYNPEKKIEDKDPNLSFDK